MWPNPSRKNRDEVVLWVEGKTADSNVAEPETEGNEKQKEDYDLNGGEEEEHRNCQTGELGIRKED